MTSKLTRREAAAAFMAALPATAQTAGAGAQTPEESLKAAGARVRRVAARLEKLEVPMAVEPSFSFRAF